MTIRSRISTLLLLCGLLLPGRAHSATDPNSNRLFGFVNGNRTLTYANPGPMYFVIGDLIVSPGATLTIEPGVLLYFMADQDTLHGGDFPDRAELIVHGTLNADAAAGDSIRFWQSGNGTWGQIRIDGDGSASFNRVSIHSAQKGIVHNGTGSIAHSSISAEQVGVDSGAPRVIHDCVFGDAAQALSASAPGHTLSRLTVRDCTNGLYATGPNTTLRECRLIGRGVGTGLTLVSDVTTEAEMPTNALPSEVDHYGTGVYAGNTTVRNIIVRDNTEGVRVVNGWGASVNYCTLVRNGTALLLPSSSSRIEARNSIFARNQQLITTLIGYGCYSLSTWDYCDVWSTPLGNPYCATAGAHVAGYDPFFQDEYGNDFRLSPASIFYEFSDEGAQLGAYGPGPGRPVPARRSTFGRVKTFYR